MCGGHSVHASLRGVVVLVAALHLEANRFLRRVSVLVRMCSHSAPRQGSFAQCDVRMYWRAKRSCVSSCGSHQGNLIRMFWQSLAQPHLSAARFVVYHLYLSWPLCHCLPAASPGLPAVPSSRRLSIFSLRQCGCLIDFSCNLFLVNSLHALE